MEPKKPLKIPTYEDLMQKCESLHHQILDGAEKEYLLDKKCNELRATIVSLESENVQLREGLELYTEPWIQVGTENSGPVIGTRYNEETGECNSVPLPDGVELGVYEPPRRLKGLKHYKAVRHMNAANKIRDERNQT